MWNSDFSLLPDLAGAALLNIVEGLKVLPSPSLFETKFRTIDLNPDEQPSWIENLIKQITPQDRYIYCYYAQNAELDSVTSAYTKAKCEERDSRAYARLNTASNLFYVGSSASMRRRFLEHLGYGAPKTYALHLAQWANKMDMTILFRAALYPKEIQSGLIEVLEDALWDAEKPMFGRKGRK